MPGEHAEVAELDEPAGVAVLDGPAPAAVPLEEATDGEVLGQAEVGQPAPQAPPAPREAFLARLRALRIVYGRGPPPS